MYTERTGMAAVSCGTSHVIVSAISTPLQLGSGSLSSPMREHRNFAQFYSISVTNFSTVSEYLLLEIIWIKIMFSSHSYGCFYVCMQCTSKNRRLIFYGRYLAFVQCQSRGPRHEWKQSMCLSAWRQNDTRCNLYTAICGITGLEIECRFQWCKCRGLQTSLVARTHFSQKLAKKKLNRKTPSNV